MGSALIDLLLVCAGAAAATLGWLVRGLLDRPSGERQAVATFDGPQEPDTVFRREPEPDTMPVPRERGAADFSEDEIEAGIDQLSEMYRASDLPSPEPAVLRQHAMLLLAGEPVE